MKNSTLRPASHRGQRLALFVRGWSITVLLLLSLNARHGRILAQGSSKTASGVYLIHGTVSSIDGKPVSGARVILQGNGIGGSDEETSDSKGSFTFSVNHVGNYSITAEKLGLRSETAAVPLADPQAGMDVSLVLSQQSSNTNIPPVGAVQFSDQPDFTVAGVTDFTAVGGHGSDSTLRTSEALASETSNLKSDEVAGSGSVHAIPPEDEERLRSSLARSPDNFEANHALGKLYYEAGQFTQALPLLKHAYQLDQNNYQNELQLALSCKAIGDAAHSRKYIEELLIHQKDGDLYRIAAELDESLGNPLAAVREFQKAAALDPSEKNLFAWGSELLLHRAILQAQQVFERGVKQYPASSRMLTGLGTALFSGAAYEQAAVNLCKASDLKPTDPEPYTFLGKVQMAAPNRLDCVEEKLLRFVHEQQNSASAKFFYSMALQKHEDYTTNQETKRRAEALLRSAVAIDPKYSEAYLQLGNLYAAQKDSTQAIEFYNRAIATNPQLSDAYYRLAVAFDRTGQAAKAKEEFILHDTVAKRQAEETERQRQAIKQFLVALPPEGATAGSSRVPN